MGKIIFRAIPVDIDYMIYNSNLTGDNYVYGWYSKGGFKKELDTSLDIHFSCYEFRDIIMQPTYENGHIISLKMVEIEPETLQVSIDEDNKLYNDYKEQNNANG